MKNVQERKIGTETFLQRLVENRVEESEALQKIENLELAEINENCICVSLWFPRRKVDGSKITAEEILSVAKEKSSADICFVHYLGNVVLCYAKPEEWKIQAETKYLAKSLREDIGIRAAIGIGNVHQGVKGISRSYKESEKAICVHVILREKLCYTYEEYQKIEAISNKKIEVDWQDFLYSIEKGMWPQVEKYIFEYVKKIEETYITDHVYRKLLAMDMIAQAAVALSKYGKGIMDIMGKESFLEEVARIETINDMEEILVKTIHKIVQYRKRIHARKGNVLIENAKQFLNENLENPDLGLKMTAKELFTNESYLSRVFKREVGESMMEYILRKRVEKSIVLLQTTNLKVYEIADRVGISNPNYFSTCFKKHMGITVKEYKEKYVK